MVATLDLSDAEDGIPEEVVELTYHFLPPARQAEVDAALRALQEDRRLEFLLAVFEIKVNDRRLAPNAAPSPALLRKILQALDQEDGAAMLYGSPYNQLGQSDRVVEEPRVEWWNLDLAGRLYRAAGLRSVRAFLEHGTGRTAGRPPEEARRLHDLLLHGLVGDSRNFAVWGCSDIRIPGQAGPPPATESGEAVWPAEDVSPWFHGVFWDDLMFTLNPAESTLSVLALTSG